MNYPVCKWLFLFSVVALMAVPANSQAPNSGQSSALESFDDSLHARGISTSKPSLLQALQNTDPEIRKLAALKLAEDHREYAVPSIRRALSSESVPSVRISFATALLSLHDPMGLKYLQGMCADDSLSINEIRDVVKNLETMSESGASCADRVTDYLGSHQDSESRLRTIWMLSDFYKSVAKDKQGRISELLEEMLGDRDPSVRLAAGHAAAHANIISLVPSLRAAIENEADPNVRQSLEQDLKKLKVGQ